MPTAEEFLAAAWSASDDFGLKPSDITLLSHSENVVFRVELEDARVVMRLHRPGYNTVAQMESEVVWSSALRDAGIEVPKAIPTATGTYYAPVECGDEERQVGVVEWVDGEPLGGPLDSGGSTPVEQYSGIGAIAAQIRNHASQWTPPEGFTRRSWNADALVGEQPSWGRFWAVDTLTVAQADILSRLRGMLRDQLTALSTGPDVFGLIHADLHLGNVMSDGSNLTAIDFDDAGYGWYVYEAAVALESTVGEPWEAEARSQFLGGYRSVHPFGADEEALIDTFLMMRTAMIVGWLDARPELPVYAQLGDLAADAAQKAERYLDRN